jgi:hypothetical protein
MAKDLNPLHFAPRSIHFGSRAISFSIKSWPPFQRPGTQACVEAIAWLYVQRLATRLKDQSGDTDDNWPTRLHGLELLAGVDIHELKATTQQALL